MSMISRLVDGLAAEHGDDNVFHPIASEQTLDQIVADQHYLRVWLRSARIVNVREWTSKFHAAVHARFTFLDRAAGMQEVVGTVAPTKSFEELDAAHLDRFITINRPLLGPIPYRGQLGMEVGLFSVKATDLAKPYLDLLLNLSQTAGVSLLSALQPFAGTIRQGAELLFQNKAYSELEVGIDKTDTLIGVGNFIVARIPKGEVDFAQLTLDPRDWKLMHADGAPVTAFPYMVLGVEKVLQRDDYTSIKDIRDGWEAIRAAAQQGRPGAEIEDRFSQLRREIWLSPDLVDADKKRILEIFRNNLTQAGFGAIAEVAVRGAAVEESLAPPVDAGALKPLAEIFSESAPPPLPPRISLEEFTRRLSDPSIPEASLRPYLIADERLSKPFAPAFVPNPDLVEMPRDIAVEEGLQAMALGNALARERRQAAFRIRRVLGDPRPVLVSEGDSWFQFPWFLNDVIDCLGSEYSIWSLDAAGDTLKAIMKQKEYLLALREFRSSVKALLFSASGNDIIGEDEFTIGGQLFTQPVIAQMLKPFADGLTAHDYFDTAMFRERLSFIRNAHAELFASVEGEFPNLPVICHGYDYAIPALAVGETRNPAWVKVDNWLGGPFRAALHISAPTLQQEIVRLMIDELNATLKGLCGGNNPDGRFRNAWHVDVRRTLRPGLWADEVHPTDAGYKLVADKFREALTAAMSRV